MASIDRTSIMPQLGETARGEATSAPVARPTPSPFPRTEGEPTEGRHRLSDDGWRRRGQLRVDRLTAQNEELLARYRARLHCADVQKQLDAGRAS